MHLQEDEDWIDGFSSWEEVLSQLQDEWLRVEDLKQRLVLTYGYAELAVVERDRRLRAQQRRGLHRLGFRGVSAGRLTTWSWDIDAAMLTDDLASSPHPLDSLLDGRYSDVEPQRITRLRRDLARRQLIALQSQQVVREVFRSSPGDLVVVLYREPAWWGEECDEEDDEDLYPLPTG